MRPIVKVTVRCTIKESDLDVLEATLLTKEEAEQLPKRLKEYDAWWWLKSPSRYSDSAIYVSASGGMSDGGVWYVGKVRPALKISNLESSGLKVGDKFEFGGQEFEIISDDKAFCLNDIGECAFRRDLRVNYYENSNIKDFVDEWFERSKKESNNEDKEKEIDSENEIKEIKEELDRLSRELEEIRQTISPQKSYDDTEDTHSHIPLACRFCPSDPRNGGSGCDCVDLESYNYPTITYDPIYNEYYNKSKSTTNTYGKTTLHKFEKSIKESNDES